MAKNKNTSGIIYRFTHINNGKAYIGQTIHTLSRRISYHNSDIKSGSNNKFHNAVRKYGWHAFDGEILADNVPVAHLDYLEQYFICLHATYEHGYNTTIGGDVNPMRGRKHRPSSIEKIRASLMGRPCSQETREKMRSASLGKKHSKDSRKKISKNHSDVSGNNNPMYGINLYDHWEKKIGAEEAKRKIAVHKKNLSESIKGRMAGEKNPGAKITQDIVDEIRRLYKEGCTLKILSEKYSISKSNVCCIVNYKTWRNK